MSTRNAEEWRPIPNYKDIYEVSNHGRVRRIAKTCNGTQVRILSGSNCNGYREIFLWRHGKATRQYIHRLVLQCFLEKSTAQINHRDGCKTNNYIDNLEYCTPTENITHAYQANLRTAANRKLTEDAVREIVSLKPYMSYRKLADKFNVHIGTITQIFSGRTWKMVTGLKS